MTRNSNNVAKLDARIAQLVFWARITAYITIGAFVVCTISAPVTYMFSLDFETWPQYVVIISLMVFAVGLIATLGMGGEIAELDERKRAVTPEDGVQE